MATRYARAFFPVMDRAESGDGSGGGGGAETAVQEEGGDLLAEINAEAGVDADTQDKTDTTRTKKPKAGARKKKSDDREAGEDAPDGEQDTSGDEAGEGSKGKGARGKGKAAESEDDDAAEEDAGEEDEDAEGGAGDDDDEEERETTDDEDASEEDADGRWPEGTPKWVQTKISKLRERLKETQARAEAAEEMASTSAVPVVDDDHPFMAAKSELELGEMERSHRKNLRQLESILEAMGESDWADRDEAEAPILKRSGKIYTRAQVRAAVNNTRDVLDEAPAVRTFFAQRKTGDALAAKEYPWMNDKESEKRKLFDKAQGALPWLKRVGNGALIVADAIEGMLMRQARAKARAQGKREEGRGKREEAEEEQEPERKKPRAGAPAPGARSASSSSGKGRGEDRQRNEKKAAATERLVKSGSTEDLTAVLEAALG